MHKQRLDTWWKRLAVLLLIGDATALLVTAFLPLPFNVRRDEGWHDSSAGQMPERTIKRVATRCADSILNGKSFARDYWILASVGDPVAAAVTQILIGQNERPTYVDVVDSDMKLVHTQLASQGPICLQQLCTTQLNARLLQQVISSCGTAVAQSRYSAWILDWNQDQMERRMPLLLSLVGLLILLSCLSLFYASTIGRLLSWIKTG